jgi:preprotein translocase subunit YajC
MTVFARLLTAALLLVLPAVGFYWNGQTHVPSSAFAVAQDKQEAPKTDGSQPAGNATDETQGKDQQQLPPGAGLLQYAPLALMVLFFYLFLIRAPMKRQQRERETLLSALKKNDKVLTTGGIIGVVAALKENSDEITLKLDDNVRVRFTKGSIVRILTADEADKDQKTNGQG